MELTEARLLQSSNDSATNRFILEASNAISKIAAGARDHLLSSAFALPGEIVLGAGVSLGLSQLQRSLPKAGVLVQSTLTLAAIQSIKHMANTANEAYEQPTKKNTNSDSNNYFAYKLGELGGELAVGLIGGALGARFAVALNDKHRALSMLSADPMKNPLVRIDSHEKHTGFAVDNDRLIATNTHNLRSGSEHYPVRTADGRVLDSQVVGLHPTADIAILRTYEPHNLSAPKLAESLGSIHNAPQNVFAVSGSGSRLNPYTVQSGKFKQAGTLEQVLEANNADLGLLDKLKQSLRSGTEPSPTFEFWKNKNRTILATSMNGSPVKSSGGPLFDETNKQVIGVVTARTLSNKHTLLSEPADKLRELVSMMQKQHLRPGLTIDEYCHLMNQKSSDVLRKFFAGELKGYLKQFSNPSEIQDAIRIVHSGSLPRIPRQS